MIKMTPAAIAVNRFGLGVFKAGKALLPNSNVIKPL